MALGVEKGYQIPEDDEPECSGPDCSGLGPSSALRLIEYLRIRGHTCHTHILPGSMLKN